MKRRLMFLIIFLITTFIVFLIITFSPKDYIYFYQKSDVLISEEFSKKDKEYLITVEYDNNKYYYKFNHKYLRKRGLLDEVKIIDSCVSPSSKYYQFYKTCINEEGYFFNLKNESLDKPVKKYERINIYDYNDHKYFVWNYTNFIVIDEDNIEKINLFKKDVYKMDMIVRINDDLLVADYNQKYQFDKMYLINLENNKVADYTINRKLYLDGYILGTYKNDVYIYDVSKETEYKINPYKERITKSGYGIYNNGSWESISINKLNKKSYYFIENKAFILEDNALYFNGVNGKIKVYDNVTNIVEQDDTSVYFVKDNTLYYASIYGTLKKIMSYSEWKFNSSNIYIY